MQHVRSKSNIGLTLEDMLGCAPEIGNFANSAYSISINVSIQSKSKSIKPKLHLNISIYLIPFKFFNQMFICIITIKNNFNSICEVSMKELEGVSNFFGGPSSLLLLQIVMKAISHICYYYFED